MRSGGRRRRPGKAKGRTPFWECGPRAQRISSKRDQKNRRYVFQPLVPMFLRPANGAAALPVPE
ncbi:hypothetical protein GCM10010394_02140 [Streptomyces crystallinus]|uniref:Uncharacterized protein n=1 Tax=Streptomyces crystallinus TaxID=68191 RepID=A0ABP3PW54_9ACTN